MSARDDDTIAFYAREAQAYASRGAPALGTWLGRFLAHVPAGGAVLELGCGAGQDSEAMLAAGYDVTPTDGTPEMARQAAERLGRPVEVLLFEDIAARDAFDGIWANACLLHVPRPALAPILANIHTALKPGGAFYASFKAGEREGHDRFGRYYNYPDPAFLTKVLGACPWASMEITPDRGSGYDGLPTDWLHLIAIKA